MDEKQLVEWFTGNEDVRVSEEEAREFISMVSADNGTEVSEQEMEQYIEWLRESGVIV